MNKTEQKLCIIIIWPLKWTATGTYHFSPWAKLNYYWHLNACTASGPRIIWLFASRASLFSTLRFSFTEHFKNSSAVVHTNKWTELKWNTNKMFGLSMMKHGSPQPSLCLRNNWPEEMWWGILQGTWWHFKTNNNVKKKTILGANDVKLKLGEYALVFFGTS